MTTIVLATFMAVSNVAVQPQHGFGWGIGSAPVVWGAFDVGEQPREGHHDDDDHSKLPKKELGKKDIGGYSVTVNQLGDVKAGEEAIFILTVTGGSGKPKSIRGWVGVESGERSIKSKAEEEDNEWHLHHEVSKPMPASSKLWVEIETASGKHKASFDIK